MSQAELVYQLSVTFSARISIRSKKLKVFYERQAQQLFIGDITHNGWNCSPAEFASRAKTSFAGD